MKEDDVPLLNQPDAVNPYRKALGLIYHRLKWDINPESWRSRSQLKKLQNKYKGQKAVILCNGPSLLQNDLSLLKGVFTFGLNKINLLFDKSDYRPSCIVAVNKLVLEQNKDFYNQTDIPLFLDYAGMEYVKKRNHITFLKETYYKAFARDCSMSLYYGHTVTFVAMQLAYHLGFQEVTLIGCDHNFATKGHANKTVESEATDPNHFDPNYFAGGMKWQLPDLFQSEVAYQMAKDMYDATGRKLYNSTIGGKLEIFERIALQDFLRK